MARNTGTGYTTAPTTAARPQAQRVAAPFSPSTGLEPVSAEFGKFFGNAMKKLEEGEMRRELRDIQVENESEQLQGWKDASLGKEVDLKLADDADYMTAREKVGAQQEVAAYQANVLELRRQAEAHAKAQAEADARRGAVSPDMAGNNTYETTHASVLGASKGAAAADEFITNLKAAGTDFDVDAAKAEALKTAFGSGMGPKVPGGSFFDKEFLSAFSAKVEPQVLQFKENRAKQVTLMSRDQLASYAGNAVQSDTFGIADLKTVMLQAEKLHPGEEVKAKPWMMGALIDSAAANPKSAARLSTLIESQGLGPNGESFAQLFPQQAAKLQSDLVNKWKSHTSIEGFARAQAVDEALSSLKVGEASLLPMDQQLARAHEIHQNLDAVLNRYGEWGEVTRIRNELEAWYGKHAEEGALLNQYRDLITDKIPWMSQGDINKTQERYLQSQGINPLHSDDEARSAAVIVGRGKQIATELAGKMSFALGDYGDPTKQRSAFYFWKGLEEQGLAKGWMSPESRRTFNAVNAAVNATQADPTAVLARMSANPELRDLPEKPEAFKWQKLLGSGKDENEAYEKARTDIVSAVSDQFGISKGDIVMSSEAEKSLLWTAGANVLVNKSAGLGDPVAVGFKDAAKDVTTNFMMVPSANGKFTMTRRTLPARGPDGTPIVSPGPSKNPVSGLVEDTNQTFREDAVLLSTVIPGRVGSAKEVYVIPEDEAKQSGLFTVMSGSHPVMFQPGETLTKEIGGTGFFDKLADTLARYTKADPEYYKSKGFFAAPAATMATQALKLPEDPLSAAALIRQTLPPGYDVMIRTDPAGESYLTLGYRFRFKDTATMKDKAQQFRPNNVPVPGPLPTTDQLQTQGVM